MKPMVRISHIWRTTMERKIDYVVLLKNVNEMILLLEFDSMRSSGKCKLNSQHLHSLYTLKEIYEGKIKATKVSKEK